MNDISEQTFAEQIAVVQARHHEREKELLELLRETVELLYTIKNHYLVNEITTQEMIEKIEKELAE